VVCRELGVCVVKFGSLCCELGGGGCRDSEVCVVSRGFVVTETGHRTLNLWLRRRLTRDVHTHATLVVVATCTCYMYNSKFMSKLVLYLREDLENLRHTIRK